MAEVRDPADAEAPYTTSELESQLDDGRNVGGESSDCYSNGKWAKAPLPSYLLELYHRGY
jgi:hypothetical protein